MNIQITGPFASQSEILSLLRDILPDDAVKNEDNRSSTHYVATVTNDEKGRRLMNDARTLLSKLKTPFRLAKRGRIGKNNPNREKYRIRNPWTRKEFYDYQTVREADAIAFDLYLYRR